MTHASVPARKSDDVARHDRDIGGVIVFAVFLVVVAGVLVGLRKIRARVLLERADRELREDIDRLSNEGE
jgi:hypothetical protein